MFMLNVWTRSFQGIRLASLICAIAFALLHGIVARSSGLNYKEVRCDHLAAINELRTIAGLPPNQLASGDVKADLAALLVDIGGAPSPLSNTEADFLDDCVERVSVLANVPKSRVASKVVLGAMAIAEGGDNVNVMCSALRACRDTPESLAIYSQLRQFVFSEASSVDDVRTFRQLFAGTIDAQLASGVIYVRSVNAAKSAASNGRPEEACRILKSDAFDDEIPTFLTRMASEHATHVMLDALVKGIEQYKSTHFDRRDSERLYSACRLFLESTDNLAHARVAEEGIELAITDMYVRKIASIAQAPASERPNRVKLVISGIGNDIVNILREAADDQTPGHKLACVAESRALAAFVSHANGAVEEHFAGQVDVIAASSEAATDVGIAHHLAEAAAIADGVERAIADRGQALEAVSTDVALVCAGVADVRQMFREGFSAIEASFDRAVGETRSLNETASASLVVLRGEFPDVVAHLDQVRESLDDIDSSIESCNRAIDNLRQSFLDGFQSTEATYENVAASNALSSRYWEIRERGAREYVKDRWDSLKKAVAGIPGILRCEACGLLEGGLWGIVSDQLCKTDNGGGGPLPDSVSRRSIEIEQEVRNRFTDRFGMVCNLADGVGPVPGEFIDQGDCAWRNGVLLCCFALNRDDAGCEQVIATLNDCWYDDTPHRSPDRAFDKEFNSDQFIPVWSGLFLTFMRCGPEAQGKAQALANRFVDRLAHEGWRLSDSSDGHFNAARQGGRFFVMQTSRAMGIDTLWRDPVNASCFGIYRKLWIIGADARAIEYAVATPLEPTSLHNFFWELLLVEMCEGQSEELSRIQCYLAEGARSQDNALFMWLDGRKSDPFDWLVHWPDNWTVRDYVWQRSRHQNNKPPIVGEHYPRLDYLVLSRLMASGLR